MTTASFPEVRALRPAWERCRFCLRTRPSFAVASQQRRAVFCFGPKFEGGRLMQVLRRVPVLIVAILIVALCGATITLAQQPAESPTAPAPAGAPPGAPATAPPGAPATAAP